MRRTVAAFAVAALQAAFLVGACNRHGHDRSTPTSPASPTPQPPSSTIAAQPKACTLPPGEGSGEDCGFEDTLFLEQVENAIDMVERDHPEVFDLRDGGPCGRCFRILNPDAYERYVVQNLEKQGLCATFDGEEFAVKNTNDLNEQFDLETADGHVRRLGGCYRGTCRPAWF
jgi:hypothetical protein